MRVWKLIVLSTTLLCLVSSAQQAPVYKGKQEQLPREVEPQPVLFSHARHAAAGILCLDCHAGANKQERAGLPQTDKCMLCHQSVMPESEQIKKIRAAREASESIDWVRVYEVPGFVFFSNHRLGHGDFTAGFFIFLGCNRFCHGNFFLFCIISKNIVGLAY